MTRQAILEPRQAAFALVAATDLGFRSSLATHQYRGAPNGAASLLLTVHDVTAVQMHAIILLSRDRSQS